MVDQEICVLSTSLFLFGLFGIGSFLSNLLLESLIFLVNDLHVLFKFKHLSFLLFIDSFSLIVFFVVFMIFDLLDPSYDLFFNEFFHELYFIIKQWQHFIWNFFTLIINHSFWFSRLFSFTIDFFCRDSPFIILVGCLSSVLVRAYPNFSII